ncbi:MAG: hypothetical protein HRT68_16395, partial [Flavobacteriaceae bacterium]|nr:hypothetical protein [Flavobacteriaceae bacterium]
NIQISLGKVLATNATNENISAYIKSIALNNHTDNESRKIIAECLFEFTKSASPNRRKNLWNAAYEYWTEWDLGGVSNDYIFNVVFSNLDFAIIGYYKECISDDKRLEIKENLINNMQLLESRWHRSSSSATTYWYRNLSLYQVIEHADRSTENADTWLLLKSYYTPEKFHKNKYNEMLVR